MGVARETGRMRERQRDGGAEDAGGGERRWRDGGSVSGGGGKWILSRKGSQRRDVPRQAWVPVC